MLSRIIKAAIAAAILLAPTMVSAQMHRTVESDGASYGPIMACIGNYAVRINAGEAARLTRFQPGSVEQLILIGVSSGRVAFQTGAVATVNRQFDRDEIRLPSGVAAARYSFARWEGYREGIPGEAVFSTEPAHRVYQLSGDNGQQPVFVSADSFASGDAKADEALLSRIVPRASVECATLDPPTAPGAEPSAAVFMPQIVAGPTTFCSGQLGIALREGERVSIFWPFDFRIAPMWILQTETATMQFGGGPPVNHPVANGRFLDAGFTQSHYPDGSGSAWFSRSGRYAFGDGSPLSIYISHPGVPREHVDAIMGRLAFFRAGRGCDVQAMPAP